MIPALSFVGEKPSRSVHQIEQITPVSVRAMFTSNMLLPLVQRHLMKHYNLYNGTYADVLVSPVGHGETRW